VPQAAIERAKTAIESIAPYKKSLQSSPPTAMLTVSSRVGFMMAAAAGTLRTTTRTACLIPINNTLRTTTMEIYL